jgi:transposase-like protein
MASPSIHPPNGALPERGLSATTGHTSIGEASPQSPKQRVALLLASGKSVTAAAEEAGLHRSTIHQWLKTDSKFAAAVDSARGEYVETLRDRLRDQAAIAVQAITDLLTSPNTPASVRLRAALAVLERPQFPKPGWNLPERIEADHERQLLDHIAVIDTDYKIMRMSRSLHSEQSRSLDPLASARQKSTLFDTNSGFSANPPAQPSRNGLCPCGSGKKYKRCCGQSAPPVLSGLPFAI